MMLANQKTKPLGRGSGRRLVLMSALAAISLTGLAVAQQLHAKQVAPSIPVIIDIPAGPFIIGSDAKERNLAYNLDQRAYGSDITRRQGWYDGEQKRKFVNLARYAITATPITNRHYAAFIAASGHRAPGVDAPTWKAYGLIHKFAATRRFQWRGTKPPRGRDDHPVVLVSHGDAAAYAAWLSKLTGKNWHLPSEAQWEKAVRGDRGFYFPWGNDFAPGRLNSADQGPNDTMAVGRFANGVSPYGVLDGAGQVYEWTDDKAGKARAVVKGGGWDDKGCGVCRPAARHTRPAALKHILIGFRLVVG